MIHAFGDSYSHTYKDADGKDHGYTFPFGHGKQGRTPDVISNRPELFKEYAKSLSKALSQVTGSAIDDDRMNELMAVVSSLKPSGENGKQETDAFRNLAREKFGYTSDFKPEDSDSAYDPKFSDLSTTQVKSVTKKIRARLDEPQKQ